MQVGEDFGGGGVLHGLILRLFILVDTEVIAVFHDLRFGDEEGFCSAGVVLFVVGDCDVASLLAMTGKGAEPGDDIGNIVVLDLGALIV